MHPGRVTPRGTRHRGTEATRDTVPDVNEEKPPPERGLSIGISLLVTRRDIAGAGSGPATSGGRIERIGLDPEPRKPPQERLSRPSV